jgi:flagellar hook-length control protein FliK
MNMPPAEGLGPTTVLDAIAPKGANLRESPSRGDSFERLLGDSLSRPSQSPADNRCADENCESESFATSAGDVEDSEAAAEVAAQETGETTSESDEDQPTDEQNATTAAVAVVVPVVPLPDLPEVVVAAADAAADETLIGSGEDAVPEVVIEISANPQLPVAAVPLEQAEVQADADALNLGEVPPVVPADVAQPPTEHQEHGETVSAIEGAESDNGPDSQDREGEQSDQGIERSSGDSPVIIAAERQATSLFTEQAKPDSSSTQRSDASQPLAAATSNISPAQPQPPNRLPPELLVAASSRPGATEQSLAVDSARLLQRVARAFAAAHDGGGEVRLRLSPPELGALRLDVRVQDGTMVARMEAETSAARSALIENLPALRERLAEQGVRIERFDVDLMRRDANGTPDRPADRQPPEQSTPQPVVRRRLPQVAEGVIARSMLPTDQEVRRLNVVV